MPMVLPGRKSLVLQDMDPSKRPGSITVWLAGLTLMVTVTALLIVLLPCIDCPLKRHNLDGIGDFAWGCPLCSGYGETKKVTLWRRWSWKPRTKEDWLEFPSDQWPPWVRDEQRRENESWLQDDQKRKNK